MTQVLDQRRTAPPSRPSTTPRAIGALWVRGAMAAAWAVAVGVALLIAGSLIVWAVDSRSGASAGSAIRFGAQLWLLAHHAPLYVHGVAVAIAPLGLTALLGLLVVHATAVLARARQASDVPDAMRIAGAVTAPYAALALVMSLVVRSPSIHPSAGGAIVMATLVGGLAATVGALRGAGLVRSSWASLPPTPRASLEAGAAAGAVLLGGATLLSVGSLLAHTARFSTLVHGYGSGSGQFSMLVLSLLLVPNAIVAGVGYLTGAGFAIGTGSSVSFSGVHLVAQPAVPILAAVPHGPTPVAVVAACIAGLVVAGAAAGWRIAGNPASVRDASLEIQLRQLLGAAAAVGLGAALLAGLAGGPAGPGRLAAVGVSPWQVGLAVAAEVMIGGAMVCAGSRWTVVSRALSRLRAGAGRARDTAG